MKIIKLSEAKNEMFKNYVMTTGISNNDNCGSVEIGTVIFHPNARVPHEGFGIHDFDEYAFVIEGSIDAQIGNERCRLEKGDFSFIPKGKKHWSENNTDKDCKLVWVKVKRN